MKCMKYENSISSEGYSGVGYIYLYSVKGGAPANWEKKLFRCQHAFDPFSFGYSLSALILTSSLKPLNGIQRNLTGSKISKSSTMFVFFGPVGKTRWPLWPLIGWDIFDFFSETAVQNSTKLDREARSQRPLPSLCFSVRLEKQDGRPGVWLAETFSTFPLKLLNGFQQNLTGSKISKSSTKFVFFGLICKTNVHFGRFFKKVAHCTQVHDMWPFGPLVSHFSHTCFDVLSWNFAHDFVLMYYRSSSSVLTLHQLFKELCLFVNLEYR